MFDDLSNRLDLFFKKIKGQARFTEKNIQEISQKLRMTLLEADVNFKVAKTFVDEITQNALHQKVHESLTPQKHYIDLVRQSLTTALGSETAEINLKAKPPLIIMMVGLQGSGKTTTSGKLARYLEKVKKRSPYLVSLDVYRPAAIEQLQTVASQLRIPAFESDAKQKPLHIAKAAIEEAHRRGLDTVILDTAGRLHIDDTLMSELSELKNVIAPHEILLVADAMTGQEAVRIASSFNEKLSITGIILSKTDAQARGGAALSMKYVTGAPIKFVGVGEKLEDLEVFHPDRQARSILKMGDVLTLIEKTKEAFDDEAVERLEKKIKGEGFTLEDFKDQMLQIQKMGSFQDILRMIPGAGKLVPQIPEGVEPEKEMKRVVSIIDSMTPKERKYVAILNGSRRLRIAKGSGTQVSEVNKLVKQFLQTKKMMKKMSKFGRNGFQKFI